MPKERAEERVKDKRDGLGTQAMPGAHGSLSPKMELTVQEGPRAPRRSKETVRGRAGGGEVCRQPGKGECSLGLMSEKR